MEYEEKQDIYQKFKPVFAKNSVISREVILEKTKLPQKKLEAFLKDNLLYRQGEEEKIFKNKNLNFKLFKIESDKEVDFKILDLRKKLEKIIGEMAYLRFNQKLG